jgi:TonB-dependent Receptor Plug Domain
MVNTTDATLGNAFDNKQIEQLPIEARNVVELLSLQPGVLFLGSRVDAFGDSRSGAVNGVRSDQSNVTLDGVDVNDQNNGYAFTSVLRNTQDSVEEFRVTTSNANADAGRSAGAQVSLVTKSGSNQFHGSLYEYNRNTDFVANDYFLKASELASGQPNQRAPLIRNVFGGALGGPGRRFHLAHQLGHRRLGPIPRSADQRQSEARQRTECVRGSADGLQCLPCGLSG